MLPLILTYAATAAGAVLGVLRPYHALLVYIGLSIVRPPGMWPGQVPPGPYSQIVAVSMLIGWFLSGMGDARLGRGQMPAMLLIAFWGWSAVSAAFAIDTTYGWDGVWELSKVLLPTIIGFTLINTLADLRKLAWTMVLAQSFIAIAGHVTVYLGSGRNWLNLRGMAGFDNNDLAAGMVAIVGVAFGLGLAEKDPRKKWVAFFCSGLIGHAILMSQSRGGMLGFCLTGVLAISLLWSERQHRKFIWLALVACLLLAGPSIRGRFVTIFERGRDRVADRSADTRVELWEVAWQIARENPVTGIGPDNFLPHSERWFYRRKVIHSLWFQTACELGVVGLFLLVALYSSTCWHAWKLFRRPPPEPFL
jgi:O-antigen ligase